MNTEAQVHSFAFGDEVRQEDGQLTVVTGITIAAGRIVYNVDGRLEPVEFETLTLSRRATESTIQWATSMLKAQGRPELVVDNAMERVDPPEPRKMRRPPLAVFNGDADPMPDGDNESNWGFRGRINQRNLEAINRVDPNDDTFF
jgi:hypothetical protein